MPKHYLFLIAAIVSEVIGTSALNASKQFTKPLPTAMVVIGYGLAFYFLTHVLKVMPVGVVYAIWSGLGIVLITLVGLVAFGQKIDLAAALGMGLIIAGVLVIHLFSRTASH
ncbi:DMT family transporter [Celeribacter sp. SCSIO 80788]|jgi:small multidrug resistance pump|uniref:DMT family transporter n=1 Tax=Celeribacter sp. SCSIO 80788 TaxID=3117013 RepID=UPI003DA53E28